ncbi:methylcobamide--CoM methyltransferase [Paraclostridium ghonii]|uniref:Uroporphyrinogen-III decarboxylase n=1 Tax=Paraclostridium ghonii TaxID=29358 RepID=A0ABU0N1D4_9FIRM|nr:uroporphyrinogen decarboxylase family protein [Paeniclostridium ghonii]MCM0167426.1 methylcobamide--CoM methyltransferase [Paeniclostridium ghonii]MDQ0556979.1 uroporphyrinogen-III decarboxylase [Paeniclostridium ghonii]
MEKIDFKCNQNDNEDIPLEIINNSNLSFPNLHTNAKDIASISKSLKKYRKDTLCKIPFCTTVEAEAFGAYINLGDEKNCPRIKDYAFSSLEELTNLENIDFEKGRIKEVLESIKILSFENETVTLNVCGPMTIISLLIDLKYFYKGLRKNRDSIDKLMKVIEDNIVNYIIKGYENGAKVISYSDPVGDINIVGPKVYEEVVSKTTINILDRSIESIDEGLIHICGKTSSALANLDKCKFIQVKYANDITYGEAICNIFENEKVKIIGNNCMKRTPHNLKDSQIYLIELI